MRPLSEVAQEADRFFMGRSPIHEAMQRIALALTDLEIPFAVAGADYATTLDEYVRKTFGELWIAAQVEEDY